MSSELEIKLLRKKEDSIIVGTEYVDILIPAFYFDSNMAEVRGQYIHSFGFVVIRYKDLMYQLKLPSNFDFGFSEIMPNETISDGEIIKVFRQNKDGVLIKSLLVVQSGANVMSSFKLLMSGKAYNIGYDDMVKLFIESSNINKVKLGVPSSIIEALVSELARYKQDPSIPFRIALTKGKATENDLEFFSLKELPRVLSVFTGLAFEDVNTAIQSGIVKSIKDKDDSISEVEKVIKL